MTGQSDEERAESRRPGQVDDPNLWKIPWKAGALSLLAAGFGTLTLIGSLAFLLLLDHQGVLVYLASLAASGHKQLYTTYAGVGIAAGIILWVVAGVVYFLIARDLLRRASLEYEKRDAAMAAIGATHMSVDRSDSPNSTGPRRPPR